MKRSNVGNIMRNEAIKKGSGKSIKEWSAIIVKAGLDTASHKEIARYLKDECGLSGWWSQEVTVQWEKETGRRITGQTADAGFQVGVSKTLPAGADKLWKHVTGPAGFSVFTGIEKGAKADLQGTGRDGTEVAVTTFEPGSHLRMRWKKRGWKDHSILQVRLTPRGEGKCALMIHHEKLADKKVREAMKTYWRERLEEFATMV